MRSTDRLLPVNAPTIINHRSINFSREHPGKMPVIVGRAAGRKKRKKKEDKRTHLDIFVSAANFFLEGSEAVGISHLTDFHGEATTEAAQDTGRLLRRGLEYRLCLLEPGGIEKRRKRNTRSHVNAVNTH